MVHNSKEWTQYVESTMIEMYRLGIRMAHPAPEERVVVACWWYLKNDRTDCINYHDLLGDSLKKALAIDDRHFLIQDLWSEVDEANPRVQITLSTIRR